MTLFQSISERICHLDPVILSGFRDGTVLLCPRCAGLHTGFILILLIYSTNILRVSIFLNAGRTIFVLTVISIACFHWMSGKLGFTVPVTESRLLTGLLSGSAFAILVCGRMNPAVTLPRILKTNKELNHPAVASGRKVNLTEAANLSFQGLITLVLMATISGYLFLSIAEITILNLVLPIIILLNLLFLIWSVIRIFSEHLISQLIKNNREVYKWRKRNEIL